HAAPDIGQRDEQFIARRAAYVVQGNAERPAGLVGVHAEAERNAVRSALLCADRCTQRDDEGNDEECDEPLHDRPHGTAAASVPDGVQPPPSAWNRLLAASSLLSRTVTRLFSAVNSVCCACSTVIKLTVPPRNCVSATSNALRELATTSDCRRSCSVYFCSAISAFSTSAKADSTALR